jgi:hypothetical protein
MTGFCTSNFVALGGTRERRASVPWRAWIRESESGEEKSTVFVETRGEGGV